ncbi:hypothetical protein PENTCL1PPCAC_3138 [Pristionchus entomophagus]|uniref:Uncharacterized protein n=1 Tax=Pristionchus entomophagus TaxID=358040 RepID=A0AAV5SFJ7_9BILA|nr:hypothetical protein PENTCL1PPCAC_3138 [Pristionchus entomophagus]
MPASPTDLDDKIADFEDGRPLGLDMKRLVDACPFSKGVAVHCHNSVMVSLEKPHEREKREEAMLTHSYEDCRSTVYDCLQMIVDGGASVSFPTTISYRIVQ